MYIDVHPDIWLKFPFRSTMFTSVSIAISCSSLEIQCFVYINVSTKHYFNWRHCCLALDPPFAKLCPVHICAPALPRSIHANLNREQLS